MSGRLKKIGGWKPIPWGMEFTGHWPYRFYGNAGCPRNTGKGRRQGVHIDLDNVTYYLGRINLVPARKKNMTRWQRALFIFMLRNAVSRFNLFKYSSGQGFGNRRTNGVLKRG